MYRIGVFPMLAGFALAMGTAMPAEAGVTMIGGGFGKACYQAALYKRGEQEGIAQCDKALNEEALNRRDRAATLVNRGILYMRTHSIELAMKDYDEAIGLEPTMAEAHINRGVALLQRGGQDQAAIDALSLGLSMGPQRPEVALYTRAIAYEMTGNMKAAYLDYQAAASLKPGWQDPVEQLKRFSVEKRATARG